MCTNTCHVADPQFFCRRLFGTLARMVCASRPTTACTDLRFVVYLSHVHADNGRVSGVSFQGRGDSPVHGVPAEVRLARVV